MATHLATSWSTLFWVVVSVAAAYAAVILCTRLAGLRSFAKMSAFDFAATIAVGSIVASVAVSSTVSIATGATALATLYGLQAVVAWLRVRTQRAERTVDNRPLVLMAGPEVLHDHLALGRVTLDDLRGKLREAGVTRRDEVQLVVLETTGDISVLTGRDPVEAWLVEGVRGTDQLGRHVLGRGD